MNADCWLGITTCKNYQSSTFPKVSANFLAKLLESAGVVFLGDTAQENKVKLVKEKHSSVIERESDSQYACSMHRRAQNVGQHCINLCAYTVSH